MPLLDRAAYEAVNFNEGLKKYMQDIIRWRKRSIIALHSLPSTPSVSLKINE